MAVDYNSMDCLQCKVVANELNGKVDGSSYRVANYKQVSDGWFVEERDVKGSSTKSEM